MVHGLPGLSGPIPSRLVPIHISNLHFFSPVGRLRRAYPQSAGPEPAKNGGARWAWLSARAATARIVESDVRAGKRIDC